MKNMEMLSKILKCLFDQRTWLFSGIGVVLMSWLAVALKSFLTRDRTKVVEPWSAIQGLQGHWIGTTTEHSNPDSSEEPIVGEITWDFTVSHDRIEATSTAIWNVQGERVRKTYVLFGDLVQDRFLRLQYKSMNREELSFGSEVLEVSTNGRTFAGRYVGYSALRGRIVSGNIVATKG